MAGNSRGYGIEGGGLAAWILVLGISFKILGESFGKTKCEGCFDGLLSSNDKESSFEADDAFGGDNDATLGFTFSVRFRRYLKNSYVDQQTAVAGIWYSTRACSPLKKPRMPATR